MGQLMESKAKPPIDRIEEESGLASNTHRTVTGVSETKNRVTEFSDKQKSEKAGQGMAARVVTPPEDKPAAPRSARSRELNNLIGGTVELELKRPQMVSSLAFLSSKGGVGKSHIAANMAYYMHRLKKRVTLVDLDLGNADITSKLGFYCDHTIYDLLTGRRRHDELTYMTPYGFHLIGGESGNLGLASLTVAQKRRLIRMFREIGHEYDFVMCDLGAGITTAILDFALAQDYQIIVTTPQDIVAGYSCLKAAYYRFQEVETAMAEHDPAYKPRLNFRPLVIINQVPTFTSGKQLFEKIVTVAKHNFVNTGGFSLDINLLGVVAHDPARIREAEMRHFLYSGKYGATPTGQCFHFLAHNLIQYRSPNSIESATSLKRFATLLMKSVEGKRYAQ